MAAAPIPPPRDGQPCPAGGSTRRTALVALAAFAVTACALTGCEPGVLDPRGAVGSANATIMIDSLAIMLAIVVPTIVATLGFAWWFSASNRKAFYLPDFEYSGRIELIVWSIPLLTVILLGGVAWIGSHALDPARPLDAREPPLEIQVVSLDWKWLFIYPEQRVASVNELVVPAARAVHFSLTSASVMNAFFVPQLGSMIYTMNGMATQLHLRADTAGSFRGLSSQFSGDGFADMSFVVNAVPPADFTAWVARVRGNGPVLDAESYVGLAQQSRNTRPLTFRDADPALFGRIVMRQLPPGPGPSVGRPGPSVSPRTAE